VGLLEPVALPGEGGRRGRAEGGDESQDGRGGTRTGHGAGRLVREATQTTRESGKTAAATAGSQASALTSREGARHEWHVSERETRNEVRE